MKYAVHLIESYFVTFPVPHVNCRRQEKPDILISRLLLSMRRMYVARIRLDQHQISPCNAPINVNPVGEGGGEYGQGAEI